MINNKDFSAISIIKATDNHVEQIAKWLSDPNTNIFLSSNLRSKQVSISMIKVTIKRIDQSWNIVSYENCPVGIIVLDSYDQIDGIINLWYLIGEKNLRGKSIMSRAIKKFMKNLPFKLDVVTAWVGSNNKASIKCLEKAEFKKIGRISNSFKVDGVHDRILFEKLVSENGK